MSYEIEYSPEALAHLGGLTKRNQQTIVDAVDRSLAGEPLVETRNRKPMRANPVAPWEMRIGSLRVYYEVLDDENLVLIRAIGIKERDRVLIGGEEVEL